MRTMRPERLQQRTSAFADSLKFRLPVWPYTDDEVTSQNLWP